MGTYYYYLSTKTKRVRIDGNSEDVGLIMFSHKESWSNANPKYENARAARLSRNENIWAKRDAPKYVMHATKGSRNDVEVRQGDIIYHWNKDNPTHFAEGLFMLMAGKLRIMGKRCLEMRPYYTMLLRVLDADKPIGEQSEELRAFLEMVPSTTHQVTTKMVRTQHSSTNFQHENQFFLHCTAKSDMTIVKLHFPTAEMF